MPHEFHVLSPPMSSTTITPKILVEHGPTTSPPITYDAISAAADFSHIFSHTFLHTQTSLPATQLPTIYSCWEEALLCAQDLPLSIQDASPGAEAWRQGIKDVRSRFLHKFLVISAIFR